MGNLNCLDEAATCMDSRCDFRRPPSCKELLSSLLSTRSSNRSPIAAPPCDGAGSSMSETGRLESLEDLSPGQHNCSQLQITEFPRTHNNESRSKEGWNCLSPELCPANSQRVLDVNTVLKQRPYMAVVSHIVDSDLSVLLEENMVVTGVNGQHQRGRSCKGVLRLLHSCRSPVELELLALDGRTVTHVLERWSRQIVLTSRDRVIKSMQGAANSEGNRNAKGVVTEMWHIDVQNDTPYLSPDGAPEQSVLDYLSLENRNRPSLRPSCQPN